MFVKKGFKNKGHGYKCNLVYDERTKRKEYRKILGRVAIGVICDAFDDEKLIAAILKLVRVERIIIAFNIILQMELPEIAFILCMEYRTKTYIAGNWTGDKDAIEQLYKWNESNRWSLSFNNAHDIIQARDESLNCSIKESLKRRLDV